MTEGRPSSATECVDVAVIGGGPAGATAARQLAVWGRSSVLLARPASRHALAESLPPSCTKLLDQLGVRQAVDDAGFLRATGNTVHWGAAGERVELFAPGALGYQVARDAFDALLVQAARDAGAVVEDDAVVRRVERANDDWSVTYESSAGTHVRRARCVLDCSGRAGVVARDGWRRASVGSRTMAVAGIWERDDGWRALVPDETHTIVESYAGGWAWSVPVSVQRRYFTVMIDPELTRLPGRQQLAAAYASEIGRTERMSALVRGARLREEPWARDASPYTADRFGEMGLLLVGDAASFVDPLSSFGVKKALASAWLASVVANTWFLDASAGRPALDLFNRRERDMYDHLQRQASAMARSAATAHASEFWVERADDPGVMEGELDVGRLRTDPRVLAAFEELKRRPTVQLRAAETLRVIPCAVVRGDRVVLEDHLATPAVSEGVRYARSVDLALLKDIAQAHDQVPDMFDSYNRRAPAASLPDFLGALSTLIGLEMLTLA